MKEYQELMNKELEENVCDGCWLRSFNKSLNVHHLDGNHNNNNKDNLILVCPKCHSHIHKGFSKKVRMEEDVIERILYFRSILLKRSYSKKDLFNRIKYERYIATNYGNRTKCFCGSIKRLKFIQYDFGKKFDPANQKKIGYYICKKCSQSIQSIQ